MKITQELVDDLHAEVARLRQKVKQWEKDNQGLELALKQCSTENETLKNQFAAAVREEAKAWTEAAEERANRYLALKQSYEQNAEKQITQLRNQLLNLDTWIHDLERVWPDVKDKATERLLQEAVGGLFAARQITRQLLAKQD